MEKSKKMFFILGTIVLMVIIAAATTFIIMSMQGKDKEVEQHFDREIYDLGEFIVNVTHERGYRFIKVDMSLLINDKKAVPRITEEKAQIRDTIIKIMRQAGRELIDDPEAKGMKNLILDAINGILGTTVVEEVYFTDYVIQ